MKVVQVAIAAICVAVGGAFAHVTLAAAPVVSVSHGIEFVTVGDPGNAGYPESTADWTGDYDRRGRGAVGYEYRIGRTEITSGQWMEFLNAFAPRPIAPRVLELLGNHNDFYFGPNWSGAQRVDADPVQRTARYELRTDTPDAAHVPVWGIGWRMAAMYTNWLHNDKSLEWDALLTGAYDTRPWDRRPDTGGYTDSLAHEPDAKFWIPSLDEWAKAAYYDPDRFGPGQGGWWRRHYRSDEIPTPGYPGNPGAQTSTGIPSIPEFDREVLNITLGSYTVSLSPWGLLDTAGGTQEIVTEWTSEDPLRHYRVLTQGSYAGSSTVHPQGLEIYRAYASRAFAGGSNQLIGGDTVAGIRIAAAIPAPGAGGVMCVLLVMIGGVRLRREVGGTVQPL